MFDFAYFVLSHVLNGISGLLFCQQITQLDILLAMSMKKPPRTPLKGSFHLWTDFKSEAIDLE